MNNKKRSNRRSKGLSARLLAAAIALLLAVSPVTAYADTVDGADEGQQVNVITPNEEDNTSVDNEEITEEEVETPEEKEEPSEEDPTDPEETVEEEEDAEEESAEEEDSTPSEEDVADTAAIMLAEEGEAQPVSDEEYTVWFDGTLGLSHNKNGKGNVSDVLWYHNAENKKVTTTGQKVTLPTADETSSPDRYNYQLQGWYDVTHGQYYNTGVEVTITGDTVFYADWMPASYDFGSDEGTVSGQPDTSSFIRTDVYDYNELFNLRSAALDTDASSVDAEDHFEKWNLQTGEDSLDFVFLNWAHNDLTNKTDGNAAESIGYMSNLNDRNTNKGPLTQNIISGKDDPVVKAVFDTSDGLGKRYVGTGNYLYQYDSDSSSEYYGYYYYDSSKNAASYNQSAGRFYVYGQTEKILGQKINESRGWLSWGRRSSNDSTPFLPFNDSASKEYNEKDGSINYWFGMKSAVDFWLPNTPGEENANIANTGKQMEFKFSGDDDVWVFVDDQLVLDLGGIHGKKSGSINFSTGTVTTDGNTTTLTGVGEGDHTLTIYYLERGSSQSNCSIYFNIAPRYALTIDKVDKDDVTKHLQNAEFQIFTDEECKTPAELWDSAEECNADKDKTNTKNTFTTDSDGKANSYGFVAGHTYYIKETKAPSGYEKVSDVIKLEVASNGSMTATCDNSEFLGETKFDEASKRFTMTLKDPEKPDEPETPETPDTPDDGGDDGGHDDGGDNPPHKEEPPTPETPEETPVETPVETPEEIQEPGTESVTEVTETGDAVIATGDDSNMMLYGMMAAGAVIVLTGWMLGRKRVHI